MLNFNIKHTHTSCLMWNPPFFLIQTPRCFMAAAWSKVSLSTAGLSAKQFSLTRVKSSYQYDSNGSQRRKLSENMHTILVLTITTKPR